MREREAVDRVEQEFALRGFRDSTRQSYRLYIRQYLSFCRHAARPPHDTESVRQFLFELKETRGLAGSTVNVAYSGLRLLFESGFQVPWELPKLPRCRKRRRLPVTLKPEEVRRLFEAIPSLKHRTALRSIYSAGLRVREATHLRISDIDSVDMRILIEDGKGGKSRYVMLAHTLLDELREYWRAYRPKHFLFEGSRPGHPLHERTLQRAFAQARQTLGLDPNASVHSLRHSFALHLLQQGTPLPYIQRLLGHSAISTTMTYLRVQAEVTRVPSPLDRLQPAD